MAVLATNLGGVNGQITNLWRPAMANTRKKVAAEPILTSYTDVDSSILAWTNLDSEIESISNETQKKINTLKAKLERQIEPLVAKKVRLEKDLEDYHEYHKSDFEKIRSKKLSFGIVGFRASTELKYLKSWTAKKVLEKLKELGRVEFIKKSESVKKGEIKGSDLGDEILAQFGCYRHENNEFYFEPDRTAVANAKGKMEVVSKAS